ncbi:MAG TPA: DUF4262 domain-containing protein [Ureibacillus sp.]|uniref:DUF4262 domain-containing protein n=1 Tax=Peribacillus asahii TaxID=228899 RepID=UPI00207AE41E|nr:DUF4262 domain-containing protein [Peribacillus asahii]USK61793.1 DUF4262 domain-containing protein [Peribacillus asahii]HWL22650.1 DUF4262 domain-containing protein [Ureibacillus sp.]
MENEQWEQQMLAEYGWYMDAIFAEEYDGIHANYHTHGVQENFNHMDFQIVLNMDPEVANDIFFTLIDDINKGKRFEEGKEYSDILEGFKVTFKQYREMGRDVLKVLLPDEDGIFPTEENCDEYYKTQLDDYDFDGND